MGNVGKGLGAEGGEGGERREAEEKGVEEGNEGSEEEGGSEEGGSEEGGSEEEHVLEERVMPWSSFKTLAPADSKWKTHLLSLIALLHLVILFYVLLRSNE
eukprot:768267-Hanusia_phi.AAC.3